MRGTAGDDYLLKRPNVFVGTGSEGVLYPGDRILSINGRQTNNLSHVEAQNLFKNSGTKAELEIGRVGPTPVQPLPQESGMYYHHQGGEDLHKVHSQAKCVLTHHLKTLIDGSAGEPHDSVPLSAQPYRTLPLVSPNPKSTHDMGGAGVRPTYSSILTDHTQLSPGGRDTVPLHNQPYRTLPLVLPNPRTIHDAGEPERKYCTATVDTQEKLVPYRTSALVMPGPKTINEVGIGAPTYQPYRGPQYNTQIPHKSYVPTAGQYNSPQPLYSEDSMASTPPHPGYVQAGKRQLPSANQATASKPHESETFKIVLESEMDAVHHTQQGIVGKQFEKINGGGERPSSQISDKPRAQDPLLKNTSINQSASFKKVMYSVLGESEF